MVVNSEQKSILVILICSILLFSSCEQLSEISNPKIHNAIRIVKEQLVDPSSAKFEDVAVFDKSVCGFVNSKNALGGFAGAQRFLVDDENSVFAPSKFDPKWSKGFMECVYGSNNSRLLERNTRLFSQEVDSTLKAYSEAAKEAAKYH